MLDDYVFCGVSVTVPTSGKVIWYGTLYRNVAAATAYWDLFSTGYVRNPNGGAD